jgi:hypothetical protein
MDIQRSLNKKWVNDLSQNNLKIHFSRHISRFSPPHTKHLKLHILHSNSIKIDLNQLNKFSSQILWMKKVFRQFLSDTHSWHHNNSLKSYYTHTETTLKSFENLAKI